MRRFITLLVVLLVLGVSYFVAFGVPAQLAALFGGATQGSTPEASTGRPGATGRAGGAAATAVVTTDLELAPYEDVLRAVGSASALRSAEAVAVVSGEVTATNLSANRAVAEGEILVQLDAQTETLNLEIAQAELDQARDTVQRYERLGASGNSTVTDVAVSEARVTARLAAANLGLARIALEDRTIRAPIAGRLGLSDVEVGDFISANTVVASIDDAGSLLVEFELPERAVGLLQTGQTVLANTPTFRGRTFEGQIVAFDSRIDSVTRSVTVKAQVENAEGLLWPGMTFAVRIIRETAPLPVLPATAITWSRSGSNIWIAQDGVATQVPVTILYRRNDQVWIDAKVEVGTPVVTEGAQKLRSGSRISTPQAGDRS
ncbi:efflux RND transporter periplasmic adaptor subunit [Sulfitobacter sp. HNIBRBA2951]|uniref:efflux RND transporter periplasmic adaptor subunit n=1 Tax=Sulfitobacter aquimarinus TaxID=3158557 RepID=UPI0032DF20A2